MQVNYSTSIPETIQRFDEERVTINFDVVKVRNEEGEIPAEYQYKSILAPANESKWMEALTVALIRERYSENQEFEINRERESKTEKFAEYNSFVIECQTKARGILGL